MSAADPLLRMPARGGPPGDALWIVTAEQLARGYLRRAPDGTLTGPYVYVVIGKLEDGSFHVELPPDDAVEGEP